MDRLVSPSSGRRARWALFALGMVVVALTACDPNGTPFDSQVPAGSVRLQGAFDNLVPAESIIEARAANAFLNAGYASPRAAAQGAGPTGQLRSGNLGSRSLAPGAFSPRSLISQSASISVILTDAPDLADEGAVTTTEVQPEGGFSVDVDTSLADEESSGNYVMLAYDELLGVGVEQLIGFIELPAGADESSAGWPLGGSAQGTTVDLGTMSGDGGEAQSIVAASDQNELYELLGADQAEVLFQAQRDNALKFRANSFLNRDSSLALPDKESQVMEATLENARNAFSSIDDALGTYTYSIGFDRSRDGLAWSDFEDGSNVFVVTPPAVVTSTSGESAPIDFGPDDPIRSDTYWPNGGEPDPLDINGLSFLGPPPEGLWTVELNGELDVVVDMGFANIFDPDGNFYYFVPRVKVNVDEDDRVTGFELFFSYWDGTSGSYVDLPQDADVETEYVYVQTVTESDGSLVDEDLAFDSGVATAPSEFYWSEGSGQRSIDAFRIGFNAGSGVTVDFVFSPGEAN